MHSLGKLQRLIRYLSVLPKLLSKLIFSVLIYLFLTFEYSIHLRRHSKNDLPLDYLIITKYLSEELITNK